MNKKKGYSSKSKSITNDIEDNLFPLLVNRMNKKGRFAKLKLEDFESNFTTTKQAGFLTLKPTRWALALEQYIAESESIKHTWQYSVSGKKGSAQREFV